MTLKTTGNIRQILHQKRKEAGITQLEVAQALGVSTSTVSRWEKGIKGIPLNHAEQMAKMYKQRLEKNQAAVLALVGYLQVKE